MEKKPEDNLEDVDALESLDPVTSNDQSSGEDKAPVDATSDSTDSSTPVANPNSGTREGAFSKARRKITQINIYFVLFLLIFTIATAVFFISLQQSRQEEVVPELSPQDLTDTDLDNISGNEVKVGDPKQTLNVESNAVFSGQVLIQGSLDVAGTIKSGGPLSLPGLTVSGQGNFNEIQANDLRVEGGASVQGQLNIQDKLTVAAGASFGGPISAPVISTNNLQLSGNLVIPKHIDTTGGTPSRSNGSALGGGGTTSISGTDTAGTVRINTGNSPNPGCFITVNFTAKFNQVPHVVISPNGSGGGGVNYYVNKTTGGFSICTSNSAPGNANFGFDYIAIE